MGIWEDMRRYGREEEGEGKGRDEYEGIWDVEFNWVMVGGIGGIGFDLVVVVGWLNGG